MHVPESRARRPNQIGPGGVASVVILTVSTVKDTVPNLRRFVSRNLGNGVDHLIVFLDVGSLDSDNLAAEAFLRAHPQVTCIRTSDDWWQGQRPDRLNARQVHNADLANTVLTCFSWARWLFHIDSDEVVLVDRDRLEQLSDDQRVVRLAPLEAVSEWRPRRGTLFKRPLSAEELQLLTLLGAIRAPDNKAYFRGHVVGKSGFRPALDLTAGIHRPTRSDGAPEPAVEADWLRVLHFESASGEEFVRKWRNLRTSGPRPKIRRSRANLLMALDALGAADLSQRDRTKYLQRLYSRTTEDDVSTLLELGLLERIDADVRRFEPRPIDRADLAALEHALNRSGGRR